MRVRPHYDEQFKESAIELLERTFPQVAQDLGVSEWTLRDWYRKRGMAKKKKGKQSGPAAALKALQGDETPEQRLARLERENAALRRENDSLKMDREILKKAAANSIVRCNGERLKGGSDARKTTAWALSWSARRALEAVEAGPVTQRDRACAR